MTGFGRPVGRCPQAPTYRGPQYQAGDTGTIVAVLPSVARQRMPLYQVRMDVGKAAFYPDVRDVSHFVFVYRLGIRYKAALPLTAKGTGV